MTSENGFENVRKKLDEEELEGDLEERLETLMEYRSQAREVASEKKKEIEQEKEQIEDTINALARETVRAYDGPHIYELSDQIVKVLENVDADIASRGSRTIGTEKMTDDLSDLGLPFLNTMNYEDHLGRKSKMETIGNESIAGRGVLEKSKEGQIVSAAVHGDHLFYKAENPRAANMIGIGGHHFQKSKSPTAINGVTYGEHAFEKADSPYLESWHLSGRHALANSENPVIVDATIEGKHALRNARSPTLINVDGTYDAPDNSIVYEEVPDEVIAEIGPEDDIEELVSDEYRVT